LDVGFLQDIKDMNHLVNSKSNKDFHATLIVGIMLFFGIIEYFFT